MKKIFVFLAVAALTLAACEKAPLPEGGASYDENAVPWDGKGELEINITANCDWTITIPSDVDIDINPKAGNGNAVVKATLPANKEGIVLIAPFELTLTNEDGVYETMQVDIRIPVPYLTYGDKTYNVVYLQDGNYWMAENLSYLPAGATVSKTDFSDNTGVWYPCLTKGDKDVAAATDAASIAAYGYFYSPEVAFNSESLTWSKDVDQANKQGICPDGWHIPNLTEAVNLIGKCNDATHNNENAPYYNKTDKRCNLAELNESGINIFPYSYVLNGKSYGNRILNLEGVEAFRNMNSMDYIYVSTGRSEKQCYAFLVSNVAANTTIAVGYNNLTNGAHVRCVKD